MLFAKLNRAAMNEFVKSFPLLTQTIIEKHTLQPLKRDLRGYSYPFTPKENLKDGKIERETNGAMHIGRVALLIGIFHQFIKAHLPSYVETNLHFLLTELKLSEEELVCLTQFIWVCKETMEKNSADYQKIFLEQGMNEQLADILTNAITYANAPALFKNYLVKNNLNSCFDYLRMLVFFGKSFNEMSHKETLNLELLLNDFSCLAGYDANVHEALLIELTKQLHSIIRSQGDMHYGCSVLIANGATLELPKTACFSLKTKVQFEHAENVLGALSRTFKGNAFFAPYVKQDGIPEKLYEGELAYNPFVHGTTSIIFALLAKTGWTIDGPTDTLEKFGWVPFGGEIDNGGLINGNKCAPCFGRLFYPSTTSYFYNLDKIIANYTTFKKPDINEIISSLKMKVLENANSVARDINVIAILMAKLRQLGVDLYSNVFANKNDANYFCSEIKALIQLFYLYLLLGKHIHPDFNLINQEDPAKLSSLFDSEYGIASLLRKVITQNIDIKKAYENPTLDNLNAVLKLLAISKYSSNPVNYFSLTTPLYRQKIDTFSWLQLAGNEKSFSWVLSCLASGTQAPFALRKWDQRILRHIQSLEYSLSLISQALLPKEVTYTQAEKYFLNSPFPLVLISEAEEKISIANFDDQEFRANQPLKMGEDITMVATDTQEHAKKIYDFLKLHNKENISVVLFEDLKKAQQSKKRPLPLPYESCSKSVTDDSFKEKKSIFSFFKSLLLRPFANLSSPAKNAVTTSIFAGLLTIFPLGLMWSTGFRIALGVFSFLTLRNIVYRQKPLTRIEEHRSLEEQNAYIAGAHAGKNWLGYFESYLSKEAWKHPRYFGAGFHHSHQDLPGDRLTTRIKNGFS